MNEVLDSVCRTLGISERMLFPERYMNDKEKQEYMEGYNNWLKNILDKGE